MSVGEPVTTTFSLKLAVIEIAWPALYAPGRELKPATVGAAASYVKLLLVVALLPATSVALAVRL